MAHFAEIDKSGVVTRVIVAEQDFIDSGAMGDPKNWIQTSYNGSFRKNYAGIGYYYDENRDAFIPPIPFNTWILDEITANWKAPKEIPKDGRIYYWDNNKNDWAVNTVLSSVSNVLGDLL